MDRHHILRVFRRLTLLHGLWQGFVFLTGLSIMGGVALAQPDSLWSREYGDGNSWGISCLQTADGGYAMVGRWERSGGYLLVKASANGDTLSSRVYDIQYSGYCYGICAAFDGGYLIFGEGLTLIRVNSSGDTLWTRGYSQFGGKCAIQTADSGFVIAGSNWGYGNLLKVGANGDILWSRVYDSLNVRLTTCAETPDGGFILSGDIQNAPPAGYDFCLIKTDHIGNLTWMRTYGSSEDENWGTLELAADGGYAVVGTIINWGGGQEDVWLLKTNAQGDSLWSRRFGGPGTDRTHAIRRVADGGFVIGAQTTSYGVGGDDYWLIRVNASGDSLWSRTFGTPYEDWCNDVIVTLDGGYAMFGGTRGSAEAFWLVKTARDPLLSARSSFNPYPLALSLSNYPNPFNSSTWIEFDLPKAGNTSLKVFDVLGQEVATINDGRMSAGNHRLLFDGEGFASGTYVIRLQASGAEQTKKITLIK